HHYIGFGEARLTGKCRDGALDSCRAFGDDRGVVFLLAECWNQRHDRIILLPTALQLGSRVTLRWSADLRTAPQDPTPCRQFPCRRLVSQSDPWERTDTVSMRMPPS